MRRLRYCDQVRINKIDQDIGYIGATFYGEIEKPGEEEARRRLDKLEEIPDSNNWI
jgi:hypothetical protein